MHLADGDGLDDGATYHGQVAEGTDIRQGMGRLERPNGESYSGQFLANQFHHKGTFAFAPGDPHGRKEYAGCFDKGKFDGPGVVTLNNGDSYWGRWGEGKLQG